MFQPPFTTPLVRGDVVAHQTENHHHHVLSDANRVAIGHLGDGNATLHGSGQIDVVGADSGGDRHLQLGCFGDPLAGQIGWPERLRAAANGGLSSARE